MHLNATKLLKKVWWSEPIFDGSFLADWKTHFFCYFLNHFQRFQSPLKFQFVPCFIPHFIHFFNTHFANFEIFLDLFLPLICFFWTLCHFQFFHNFLHYFPHCLMSFFSQFCLSFINFSDNFMAFSPLGNRENPLSHLRCLAHI